LLQSIWFASAGRGGDMAADDDEVTEVIGAVLAVAVAVL
jgi:hypothetical protein